ncbi:MAG: xanthine dehydrogenase family protein subunit M [Acidimicrobiia bacterium]
MKPAPFKLVRPTTVAEACAALAEHGEDARVLAGGQSLVPTMNFRLSQPTVLVDLERVEGLDSVSRRNGDLAVGAMVRQRDAERNDVIREDAPLISVALPFVGHVQNRNRGTIGGSIAHADPAAELPAVAIAAGARVRLVSSGSEREVPALDFFEGPFMTTIEHGEIVTEVVFPARSGVRVSLQELARRHGDFAIAGVAVIVELDGEGVVSNIGSGAFGVTSSVIKLPAVESEVVGRRLDAATIKNAARAAANEPQRVTDDTHASEAYRRELLGTMVGRALADVAD